MEQSFVAEISSLFVGLKATAAVAPQHWQPSNGLLMTNDVPENAEDVVPCVALSKNDSYVMSACGGKVSLFNMMNFKVNLPIPCKCLLTHRQVYYCFHCDRQLCYESEDIVDFDVIDYVI